MAEADSHTVDSPLSSKCMPARQPCLCQPCLLSHGCCVVDMQGQAYRLSQRVCCVLLRVPLSSAPHAPASATSYAHSGLERHTSKMGLCMVYTTFQRYAYLADAIIGCSADAADMSRVHSAALLPS